MLNAVLRPCQDTVKTLHANFALNEFELSMNVLCAASSSFNRAPNDSLGDEATLTMPNSPAAWQRPSVLQAEDRLDADKTMQE